jgi:hypothetical protein
LTCLRARNHDRDGSNSVPPLQADQQSLQPVGESKVGKSRLHVDFWVNDLPAAIALVQGLGGRTLDQHVFGEWSIHVMTDPEGVEFCPVGESPAHPPS